MVGLVVLVAIAVAGLECVRGSGVVGEQFRTFFGHSEEEVGVGWVVVGKDVGVEGYCEFEGRRVTAVGSGYVNLFPNCTYGGEYGLDCVKWHGTVFRALLQPIRRSASNWTVVEYRCGVEGGEEKGGVLRLPPTQPNSTRFLAMGDLGTYPASRAVEEAVEEVVDGAGGVSFVGFWGDLSYANANGSVWDDWGRLWEQVTRQTLGLYCLGNHDAGAFPFGNDMPGTGEGDSGEAYASRLSLGPGPNVTFQGPSYLGSVWSRSFWGVVEVGVVKVFALSTVMEFEPGSAQFEWLEAQLRASAGFDGFLVVAQHFPMYASMGDCFGTKSYLSKNSTCGAESGILAVTARKVKDALEPLLLKYNVSLAQSGHEHAYERTFPVANFSTAPKHDPTQTVFRDPPFPIHQMIGSGGASADSDWSPQQPHWSAVRSDADATRRAPFGYADTTAFRAGSPEALALCNDSDAHALQSTFHSTVVGVLDSFVICKKSLAKP